MDGKLNKNNKENSKYSNLSLESDLFDLKSFKKHLTKSLRNGKKNN